MTEAVRTVTDLLTRVNLVGIDFANVRTVLHRDGLAGAGGGDAGSEAAVRGMTNKPVTAAGKPMIHAVMETALKHSTSPADTLFGLIGDPRNREAAEALLQAAWMAAHGHPRADSVDHMPDERGALIMTLLQAAQPGRDWAAEFAQQRADHNRISEEEAREAASGRSSPVAVRPVALSGDLDDDGIPF